VVTPEQVVFDGEADMVVARIADGDLAVMADHAPTISTLKPRETRIRRGEELSIFATSDGFFKVSENLVQILVEEALAPEEIDVEESERAIEGAQQEISDAAGAEDTERRIKEAERWRAIYENRVIVARRHAGS
jgi:F-type H+-transporting ATPase subunit epsilon